MGHYPSGKSHPAAVATILPGSRGRSPSRGAPSEIHPLSFSYGMISTVPGLIVGVPSIV